ncbi:MAG TPA: Hsp70 family protein [Chitinispirillaceae bacterium]|nr:Hsp70 family protein [Chitinispirillaceae bacterium]
MAELIAGIDLGTTNSEISFFIDGKIVLIPIDGDPVMPSCVGIDPSGKMIVGRSAKNQMVSYPESTVVSIKRKMGNDVHVTLGDKSFSPEEVSAIILRQLKNKAEEYLKQPVKKAVITVPAFFQDHQRQATLEAGKLAGLDVVRIINEPTAASVAYEADHSGNQNILVYDLGGGTFDVSLVSVENGIVEVKSSHGDTLLGGDDFDNLIIEHLLKHIKESHSTDLSSDKKIRQRLWKAAEKAKRDLSDHPFTKIREEYITDSIHLDIEISREEYESMIMPLLQKTLDCIHACLGDVGKVSGDIDRVLLVGGSTRTPLVHTLIERMLNKTPQGEINPDLIVSMGAAAHGAVIGGVTTHSILVDITPFSFGTSAVDFEDDRPNYDKFVPVIKRNTPLPASKTEAFCTVLDGQESVEVNIYQGESASASANTFIGKFLIQGLSDIPAPNVILLNLELDLNGMLKVTATEKSTGLSKTVMMDTKKPQASNNTNASENLFTGLPEMEGIDFDSGTESTDEDFISSDNSSDGNDLLIQAKSLRKRAEKLLGSNINKEDAEELKDLLEKSREAVASGETGLLSDYNASLEDLVFYLED